jgi:hypothetical protein
MSSNGGTLRLAVLIDGENIPAKDAANLFAHVHKLGNPIIRRVYGDFTRDGVKEWPKVISEHGGSAHQNGHTSAGKNASDIALAVDAMDFLHKRSVDGFCIVTSDGDFTSLAKRIREEGLKVYGFAHSTAAKALQVACDQFFPLAAAKPAKQAAFAPPNESPPKATAKSSGPSPAARKPNLAKAAIEEAFSASESEWMTLSALGTALRARDAGYLKKTGFASLKKLLTALNDHYHQCLAADGKTAQVRRRKPAANTVEKSENNTTKAKMPHVAWPWIEAAMPADLKEWITLSALEQVLNTRHPDYLEKAGHTSLKAILRALTDHFEMGLAEDGKAVQVRRRTA